jgi:hypothetical protein
MDTSGNLKPQKKYTMSDRKDPESIVRERLRCNYFQPTPVFTLVGEGDTT